MDLSYPSDQNMSPTQASTSYLPGYLLGGNSQTSTPMPMNRNWSSSTQKSLSPRSQFGSPGRSVASPQQQFTTNPKLQHSSLRGTPTISRTPKDSIGAPPVEGLYDAKCAMPSPLAERRQLNSSSVFSPGNRTVQQTSVQGTPGASFTKSFTVTESHSPPSPAQVDPFYTQGESLSSNDILSDCWVTVFGFPPSAASYILQQFSQYGNIMRHEVMTNTNWMHIQYQSKLQAKKALSKHGKVFGGNLMIAVVPCIEKSVMETLGKENTILTNDQTIADVSMKTVNPTPIKPPIRPLTAAYQAVSSNHQVVPQDGKIPQKNDTIISKAMEYMFGW